MADGSPIEWLQKPGFKPATWNPTRGCARQGAGCKNCWAISMARRQDVPGGAYEGLTTIRNGRVDWLGTSRPAPDMLDLPLRWKKPRCIFVESMGDLFHPGIPFEYIAACFGVMAATPQHVHIILTKQPKRARAFFDWFGAKYKSSARAWIESYAWEAARRAGANVGAQPRHGRWPLPNVWLLVSAWDQPSFEKYAPDLIACPAAVRGLSAEPLLGPIAIGKYFGNRSTIQLGGVVVGELKNRSFEGSQPGIDWVIAGGESGSRARPMQEAWAHSLRDQCTEAGVPFHFKQWGNHAPNGVGELVRLRSKKLGGRILSGRTWDEFPAART